MSFCAHNIQIFIPNIVADIFLWHFGGQLWDLFRFISFDLLPWL